MHSTRIALKENYLFCWTRTARENGKVYLVEQNKFLLVNLVLLTQIHRLLVTIIMNKFLAYDML